MRNAGKEITRIYVEKNQRSKDFTMSTHHYHPYYEMYYLNHGVCRFFINNTFFLLHDGDIMIIPKHSLHYTKYPQSCLRTAVFFREADLAAVEDCIDFTHSYQGMRLFHVPEANRDRMESILDNMLTEMRFNDPSTPISLRLQLQTFFMMMHRYCIPANESYQQLHTTDEQVIKAARYISAHYSEHIQTKDIAAAASLTPNYLSSKFREVTGIGLHEYLVFIRLHHAETCLLSTDHTITSIALECGFSDSNYFKDAFKKMYGDSPRAYKKKAV